MSQRTVVVGRNISLRFVESQDLQRIAEFAYSVSITEPHDDLERLTALHSETGLWGDDAGAVAMVENSSDRMIGTLQHYVGAPCIHGMELGYVIHDPADRSHGYAGEALRLFSDHLFEAQPLMYRQQLLIEVWNTPSWRVGERAGFVREGILRSSGFGSGDPADSFIYSRTRRDYSQQLDSANG